MTYLCFIVNNLTLNTMKINDLVRVANNRHGELNPGHQVRILEINDRLVKVETLKSDRQFEIDLAT
jgi:hypothetical protein